MQFKSAIILATSILLIACVGEGKKPARKKHSAEVTRLIETIQHYRNQPEVDWEVQKKVQSGLMNQTTESKGKFYFSRSLFHLQFPEESAIFDGKAFWLISQLDKDSPRQVTKSLPERSSNVLLDIFQLKKGSSSKLFHKLDENRFQLVKKAGSAIQNVVVELNSKDQLKTISYKDDLENQTEFDFLSEQLKRKKNSDLFQFKKKKTDRLTEM